jgi:hypothetical protein
MGQGVLDGFALRIQDRFLRSNDDFGFHARPQSFRFQVSGFKFEVKTVQPAADAPQYRLFFPILQIRRIPRHSGVKTIHQTVWYQDLTKDPISAIEFSRHLRHRIAHE